MSTFYQGYMYASMISRHRVSVCPSVTSRHCSDCTKTAKRKIMQTTPRDSPGTLAFRRQK